ncbi:MAG: preprotein translocase subunit YajC [Clostridiaceae bacterium]|jgi:preprotein translocase subunit YajC|nr:preprotein translocase subunit YajC [Clostridiaceae bacterium]
MTLFPLLLMAAANPSGEEQSGGALSLLYTMLPFVLIVGVMYFFTIRPQKKREKKLKETIASMRPGDKVMSIGGIVGQVANITDDEVSIYTSADRTMLTFKKTAISTVFPRDSAVES